MRAAASTLQRWWRRRRWQLAVQESRRVRGAGGPHNRGKWIKCGCPEILAPLQDDGPLSRLHRPGTSVVDSL